MRGQESSSRELYPDEKKGIVISKARAHDQGQTSLVYGLKIVLDSQDEENARVLGNPFRLEDEDGRYIWYNKELRDDENEIEVGSIISYRLHKPFQERRYVGNTKKKLETNKILSLLNFRECGGMVYPSVKEAFPNAVIAKTKGIYQETRPNHPYALISISYAVKVDGRIELVTRSEEVVTLSNRCASHTSDPTKLVTLPVQDPSSEEDVGAVILVGFGTNPMKNGRYQAVCEGILCEECPGLPSYKMKSSPRGKCIIINNDQFHNVAYNRDGAKHDEKRLKDLFEELGFVVDVRRNLTRDEINKTSKDVAAEDHSNFDAFVFIIMSHGGSRDAVCGVDDRAAYVEDVMSEFKAIKCPTLRNKPKLFFIQCCRGPLSEFISPPDRHCDSLVPTLNHDSTLARGACAQETDFLLAFASAPGHYSYRYPESGSVFIEVLVDVIRKHRKHSHLIEMLTEVTRQVVERGTTAGDKMPRVQVPAYSNTLRAKLPL
ncbi:hypothetical protein ACROYT_G023572 [Oculina patagonica]